MKERVDAYIGNLKYCLLMGRQPANTIEYAHWLRRELKSIDEDLFYRIQNAIGIIVQLADKSLVRQLRLDSPDNQDQMSSSAHASFDGRLGPGSGSWCLVPLNRSLPLTRLQWFPKRTNLFYVHIFAGEEPINIYYKGHLPRTYAECREAISQEQLEAEAPVIASLSLAADHVIPSANPEDTGRIYTLDPAKPSRKVLIVRSHLNIANVLAETTSKLLWREKHRKPTNGADLRLSRSILPTTGRWYDDDAEAPNMNQEPDRPVPDEIVKNRQSARIKNARTAPVPQSKAKRVVPKRKVMGSAPAVPSTPRTAGLKRKRSSSRISAATSSKPANPRTTATASKATGRRPPAATPKEPADSEPSKKKKPNLDCD
ncbi:hypothetical protein EV715DRAFT_205308 [Schizophyllum commune]